MGYFSSGTEGMDYAAQYCDRCVHGGDDPVCAVWQAHVLNNYEECNRPDSILHVLIPRGVTGENKACRLFLRRDGA